MVFSSAAVVAVADLSTDAWQRIGRIPASERVNSLQLLDMACCFPLHQLGRMVLCLWTFICLPSPDSFYSYSFSSFSRSSSSSDDDDDLGHVYFNYGHYVDDGSSPSSSTIDFDDYCYHSHSD